MHLCQNIVESLHGCIHLLYKQTCAGSSCSCVNATKGALLLYCFQCCRLYLPPARSQSHQEFWSNRSYCWDKLGWGEVLLYKVKCFPKLLFYIRTCLIYLHCTFGNKCKKHWSMDNIKCYHICLIIRLLNKLHLLF